MKDKLLLSHAPHISGKGSVPAIMYIVIAALMPATAMGIYFFGINALILILTCIITALITEYLMTKIMKIENTIGDGSAALTGLLMALIIPASAPIFTAIIGTVFAIAIVKMLFGGLGYNIFNPALAGRAFLAAAFPVIMTTWVVPFQAVTSATPLAVMKFEHVLTPLNQLFFGDIPGCIGETSALAILIGGLFLMLVGIVNWRMPASYLGSVIIFSGILWIINPSLYPSPIFHLFSGGLMLGAFFMATDPVTTPLTSKGLWIFGIGAGILLIVIRQWGGLPEGVMYSILFMNAFTPLINRYTRPRIFGSKI
ncbi:MAG: RnfABCDGE type electron transport complex subunit D [bacterium]